MPEASLYGVIEGTGNGFFFQFFFSFPFFRCCFNSHGVAIMQAQSGQENGQAITNEPPGSSKEEMKAQLHSELSIEDPYNGEMVVRGIEQPFYFTSETDEIDSWKI
jgi:hypothetical protein